MPKNPDWVGLRKNVTKGIHKKILSDNIHLISNEETEDIMKLVKSLEDSG